MSATNRRLARLCPSLFAGASLAALAAAGAVTLAPGRALAANECGNPAANGTAADVLICTGTFAAIDYSTTSSGALTLQLQNGVAATSGGLVIVGKSGELLTVSRIDTPADAGDPSLVGTAGPGLRVESPSSNIVVNLTDTDAGDTPIVIRGTSAGVRLQNAGTGSTVFTMTNGSVTATDGPGIHATTTGTGAITMTAGGAVTGTGVGVLAQGGGNVALTANATITGAVAYQGTTTGTGTLSLNAAGGDVVGTTGAVLFTPNANASVIIGAGRTVRADAGANAVVEVTAINASRTFTLNNNGGTLRSNDAGVSGYDDLILRVAGAGSVTLNSTGAGLLQGRLALTNTGATSITVGGTGAWHTVGTNALGDGDGSFNLAFGTLLTTNTGGAATSLDFGAGTDVFTQTGMLAMGDGAQAATTLTVNGLETWFSSGLILFGADATYTGSDGFANDRILAPGVDFVQASTELGAARLAMDVNLGGTTQAGCATLTAADCFSLAGGTTAGFTAIIVNDISGSPTGTANAGMVLVDVSGAGSSGAGHFILSPESDFWRADASDDGVLDKGLFFYDLIYDGANKQHLLVGLLDEEAIELSTLGMAAQGVWQTTTGTWTERQADLRDSLAGRSAGRGPGVWMKPAGAFSSRELFQSYQAFGGGYHFNNNYDQRGGALMGGVDLVSVDEEARSYVIGLTGGLARTELDFGASPTIVELQGSSLGAYASYDGGGFFVDAIVNANALDIEHANATLTPAETSGQADTLGGQLEGGLRVQFNEAAAFFEPLAIVSYARTQIDDIAMPGALFEFDEMVSFRGALGARLSGAVTGESYRVKFSATGRVWEEFEAQNRLTVAAGGASMPLLDDFGGTLGDLGVGVSAFLADGALSGFVNVGKTFKEQYHSTAVSLGLGYRW